MENIEEGKEYCGVVKSLTPYGAFVDLGGVDGLIHISQIADKHINKPSDVLSIGDEVKVRIIEIDSEKKRINLSMREANTETVEDIAPAEARAEND